jgi:hypothetical protein
MVAKPSDDSRKIFKTLPVQITFHLGMLPRPRPPRKLVKKHSFLPPRPPLPVDLRIPRARPENMPPFFQT